ncbi:MAG: DUF937 domain-containing protein [Clostridiales bacterium]|nr:DUF937 domain-containing protein [Clostridiales bacterium]
MDLLKGILDQVMSGGNVNKLAEKLNMDKGAVGKAVEAGLPAILEGLNQNSNNKEGALSLDKALGKHNGSILDDIKSGDFSNIDLGDGKKIIGHIFGDNTDAVTQQLGKKAGISSKQSGNLLSALGPIIMGFLGKQKEDNNLNASGISGLTSTLMQSFTGGGASDLIGMVTGLLGGGNSGDSGGGLGGLLDDLF